MKKKNKPVTEFVPQATYAKLKGISRQRVGQKVEAGQLDTAKFGGKTFVKDKQKGRKDG